jgi:hypothetical protein
MCRECFADKELAYKDFTEKAYNYTAAALEVCDCLECRVIDPDVIL